MTAILKGIHIYYRVLHYAFHDYLTMDIREYSRLLDGYIRNGSSTDIGRDTIHDEEFNLIVRYNHLQPHF